MRIILVILLNLLLGCQPEKTEFSNEQLLSEKATRIKSSHTPIYPQSSLHIKQAQAQVKDGAPLNPQNSSPIKSVHPVAEPMSRYGNRGEYQVNGKRYEVMKSAVGYRARGIASWYGTKFHTKRTSSGETYDLYGMTAAHKTLPLPTYVRVTNLNNGRKVVVKVNDRGPFHDDRIIDLSYGVAKQLGFLSTGTAPVEIEALFSEHSKGHATLDYYLQIGAFTKKEQAQALLPKIVKLSASPAFIEHFNQYYIVKAGPFSDKTNSEALKSSLAKQGITDAFTVLQ